MRTRQRIVTLLAALTLVVVSTGAAYAAEGTVTIGGGTLAVVPANITLSAVTLTGDDLTTTSTTNPWTAEDPTGTGAGWHLNIVSTDFGINEVQAVHHDGTAGDFTLSLDGGTTNTAAIPFNAVATVVKGALEGLTAVNNVTVTGDGTLASPWAITFVDPGRRNVAELTANDAALTGTVTISTTTEGRTIDISTEDQEFRITLLNAQIGVVAGNTQPVETLSSAQLVPETGALKFMTAPVDTGMGEYNLNPDFELEVRAETYAGIYTATMTITVVTGP